MTTGNREELPRSDIRYPLSDIRYPLSDIRCDFLLAFPSCGWSSGFVQQTQQTLRFLCFLAPTLLAKPQLELHAFSFGCSCSLQSATATWRIQAPVADPLALVVLCFLHGLSSCWSKLHRFVAGQVTQLAFWELACLAEPFLHFFGQ